eukprot:scaffold436_cov188-Alexandrium_tamarense.AAC.35
MKYSDGGCPCLGNQTRCGASEYSIGWCSDPDKCCDRESEMECYNDMNEVEYCAMVEEGCDCKEGHTKCFDDESKPFCVDRSSCPCPGNQIKCGAFEGYDGYCTDLCCPDTDETCYSEDWKPISCAPISEGGCNCGAGEVKCGTLCSTICCNPSTHETCSSNGNLRRPDYCAKIEEGGCPCPNSNEIKCGATQNYAGYCSLPHLCCDWSAGEHYCYDDNWNPTSCARYNETCPDGSFSYEKSGLVDFI